MNKISVIIPVFNQAEYLEECIESAYNQTVQPHEIIVVVDGSTDNSLEIAERYMFREFPGIESPVRVVSQVNKGLSSARNTGIMNATGDYILPLDADDKIAEDAIERFTRAINETGVDIVAPSFKEFGKSDREIVLQEFTIDDLRVANRLPYFCCIKRSKLLEVGGYSPRMKWGYEDYHLWFNLFVRNSSITFIKNIIGFYRVKDHSMIHEANEHADELRAQIAKDFPQAFQ
jgi:glycosyltransferase involved in cell wall biosynthesis